MRSNFVEQKLEQKYNLELIMNRTNDFHFFNCWDLIREIDDYMSVARPKEQDELLILEQAIFDDAGFDRSHSYQDAIRLYNDREV